MVAVAWAHLSDGMNVTLTQSPWQSLQYLGEDALRDARTWPQ